MREQTDAVRAALADARAELEREPAPRPKRRRPTTQNTEAGDRALRELRARHGLVKRTKHDA